MPLITDEEQLIAQQTVGKNLQEVIGQGIDFPFRFANAKTVGSIPQSNAGERIHDSIHLILSTRPGERMFNPEFGSRVPELVFEPNDEILQRLLVFYTSDALQRWEKRIEILQITILNNFDAAPNTLGIEIHYRIRNSHVRGSYVYPFVREGMPTSDLYTGSESDRMLNRGQIER